MSDLADFVGYPVLTSKACKRIETSDGSILTFSVHPRFTKTKIKSCIEEMFNVKVLSIQTHRCPRKKKDLGQYEGYSKQLKRVIFKVRKEDKLDLFAED
jgi:large subunit ribosomal protein L23